MVGVSKKQHKALGEKDELLRVMPQPVGGSLGRERGNTILVSFVSLNPPSAYSSCKVFGTFACAQNDLCKAQERELAKLDEKSTSSGIAEPYARQTLKSRIGGKEGPHL